jgi:pyridoxal phosphate enzyme (YggS family)
MTSSLSANKIAERIAQVRDQIPDSVKLIAVTKQVSVEAMRAAYEAGVRDFGESRIQEAETKQAALKDLPDLTWHLIGHLQSNKASKALEQFQWIHSLDSLKLAQRMNQLVAPLPEKPKFFLQVKLLPDPNKYGWTVPELFADLPSLEECHQLNLVGLMTIPPYGLNPTDTLAVFTQTRELAEQIQQQNRSNVQMQHLSMGMSNDYLLAVKAGATMIRLGRTLFGDRS